MSLTKTEEHDLIIAAQSGDVSAKMALVDAYVPAMRGIIDESIHGRCLDYSGQVAAVVCLDLAGTRVVQVWAVLNPDKLRSWNRPRA